MLKGMAKEHKHQYEPEYHPGVSSQARALGIRAIEVRRCKLCQKQMVFVQVDNEWLPLFEDRELSAEDILLA
jgi:hypothetical protein